MSLDTLCQGKYINMIFFFKKKQSAEAISQAAKDAEVFQKRVDEFTKNLTGSRQFDATNPMYRGDDARSDSE